MLRVEGEEVVRELDDYREEQKVYHMALCIEAGLVGGVVRKDGNALLSRSCSLRIAPVSLRLKPDQINLASATKSHPAHLK